MEPGKETTSTSRRKEGEGMNDDEGGNDGGVHTPPSTATPHAGEESKLQEFHFGEGPDGDLPPEIAQILRSLVSKSIDTGLAHDPMDDEIRPSKEQLGLGPGDLVAISHSSAQADEEFMIAQIVDPEEHAETYPDWQDRLLNSFVLVEWYSRGNTAGKLGWLARSKMVLFTKEYWDELHTWINGTEVSGDPPEWLIERYNESLAGMAEANPDRLPMPIQCPKCESYAVVVEVYHHDIATYAMGTRPEHIGKEWTELHVVTPYKKSHESSAKVFCYSCGHDQVLPPEIELLG